MFELIEGHLKKIGRNALLPAGIVLTGGGSGIPDIVSLAKQALKLPARIGSPENGFGPKSQITDPSWAVAYGLCVMGNKEEEESRAE